MKTTKTLLFILILLSLAACSKIELIEYSSEINQKEIKFGEPFVSKAFTRAATGDIDGVDGLKPYGITVWGEMYNSDYYDPTTSTNAFDNGGYRVLRWQNGSGSWTYDEPVFWTNDKNYDFVGFAPAEEAGIANYSEGKMEVSNIPVVQVIDNSSTGKSGIDYLLSDVATSRATDGTREDVRLVFKHILSRLSFYVWKDNTTKQDITLKNATLYLPSSTAKANYTEAIHNGPQPDQDTWTWEGHSDIKDATDEGDLSTYSSHTINSTSIEVPECSDDVLAEVYAQKLGKEFFIAPTPSDDDVTFYIKLTYEMGDDNGSTEITKFTKLPDLERLRQGYKHNLYIRLGEQTITFDIDRVEGWKSDSQLEGNINNINGHSYGFTAWQENFDIVGLLKVNYFDDIAFETARLQSKNNESVSDVEVNIDGWYDTAYCNGTTHEEPSEDYRYARFRILPDPTVFQGSGTYILTFVNQDGEENSTEVNISMSEMSFTIKTTEANQTFHVPMATGETPAPMAIVWGDHSESTIADSYLYSNSKAHTYKTAGTYEVRIMSLQTDSKKQQIPEFNFGKYPSSTCSMTNSAITETLDNENGQLLYSIDTPVLYTGVDELSTMFYGTGLTKICADAFSLFSNVTEMNGTFFRCSKLTAIPQGLIDNLTDLESMYCTFRGCADLLSVPATFLRYQTKVKTLQGIFRECTSLASLSDGFFSRQLLCDNYKQLVANCRNLKLSEGLFIDGSVGITKENRFKRCNTIIRIDNIFYHTKDTDAGTVPDLWNYYFTNKYGFSRGTNGLLFPVLSSSLYENKNEIPECWYKETTSYPENFELVLSE